MSNTILQMKNINKSFGPIHVLKDVNIVVEAGEIHALCGENGAGKSTMMKVLSGVYPHGSYEGDIVFQDEICSFGGIKDSEAKGIAIIHQELALIPQLSIAENIFIGNEKQKHGIVDWDATHTRAKELMNIVGLYLKTDRLVGTLSVGEQQLVEIAKALSKDIKLLILDEPTSALNEDDSENLLLLLQELQKKGLTSIIISHKLNEVTAVSNAISVIRDGEAVACLKKDKGEINEEAIIKAMVGRSLDNRYPTFEPQIGDIAFEVKHWNVYHPTQVDRLMVDNVSFNIRSGEIVGIAGLMGAGRTELALSLFGKSYGSNISGEIIKDGIPLTLNRPKQAIDAGIAYVSEDRKSAGLVLMDTINRNISMASLSKFSQYGVMDMDTEVANSVHYKSLLNIRTSSIFQKVENLSGGNQQKVVLSKWLTTEPDVLFLDEPTRGIDVGAKYEIYTIIQKMAAEGKSICVISSELPEILGICHRIYTLSEGRITGELSRSEATQENLMTLMTQEKKGKKS
ncbi:sugar ABC transporter ATP-binding protein [Erysipelothrix sp. HDW6C]|uniref:sugar ABC transporter ATP-binding protein n=1 Tax=Erysipelothrix sp. HDW6C TaxID=2714930 RepID=UPI00140E57E4|nr:sugar ABC transporter ATP-binding protein [Erysipelothrix sp. HDW6C]QIK70294.1 sugar ABC transporter ATP-binding protein [Erysipelothrix sp. HDW6C]